VANPEAYIKWDSTTYTSMVGLSVEPGGAKH
jgi:hypothetical protein